MVTIMTDKRIELVFLNKNTNNCNLKKKPGVKGTPIKLKKKKIDH